MYNDNLAHVIEFEYDNLEHLGDELFLQTITQRYCPMCDEYHVNNTYCQYPLQEAV